MDILPLNSLIWLVRRQVRINELMLCFLMFFFALNRRDVESPEAPLPTSQRSWASGEEPGWEGCAEHREAELPAVRHDHASAEQQHGEAAPGQEAPGSPARQVGEGAAAHGQTSARAHPPCTLLRCAGECFLTAAGRAVRARDKAPAIAGWARTGDRGVQIRC